MHRRFPFLSLPPSPFLFSLSWEHVLDEKQPGSFIPEVTEVAMGPLHVCANMCVPVSTVSMHVGVHIVHGAGYMCVHMKMCMYVHV